MRRVFFFFLMMALLTAGAVFAEDVSFSAAVEPQRVPVGASAQLTVTFKGTREDVQAPTIPPVEGLEFKFSGSFANSLTVNGQSSVSRNFLYTVYPSKAGTFEIPALTTTIGGKSYSSDPIQIEVTSEPLLEAENKATATATSLEDKIFLVMSAPKKEVYLQQPVEISIKLFVNGLNVRDIQMQDLLHEGFQKITSLKAKQYQQIVDGINYDVIEFNGMLYPLREGDLVVGPAKLGCSVLYESTSQTTDDPFFSGFFKSYDTRPMELASKPLAVKVLALPEAGKPKDFSGAVGQFNFEASVGPQEVKVGDPLTLKMKISGQGNMKAVEFPAFTDSRFKTYDPQIKSDETLKTWEGVIIPTSDEVKEVPAIAFNYFDPVAQQYKTITQGPFPVTVKPADKEPDFRAVEFSKPAAQQAPEELGRDLIFIKEDMGRLVPIAGFVFNRWPFWILVAVYLAAMMGLIVFYQISYRMRTDKKFERRIKAPRKAKKAMTAAQKLLEAGDVKAFYSLLDKTLRDYLGSKLHTPSPTLTAALVRDILSQSNIEARYLNDIQDILERADMVRFASATVSENDMAQDLKKLQTLIAHLEDEL